MKKVIIILGAIIAIPLVIALFVKKEYAVERSVEVNRPLAEVFDYIKHVRNQDNFSVWNQKDPNMIKSYSGEDGTVGFVYRWESENEEVGTGEQEIKAIEEGKRVDFELRFIEPFEANEPAYITTETTGENSTMVRWGFSGHMDYPMNIMMLFMNIEEMIANDLESGLGQLKTVIETMPMDTMSSEMISMYIPSSTFSFLKQKNGC